MPIPAGLVSRYTTHASCKLRTLTYVMVHADGFVGCVHRCCRPSICEGNEGSFDAFVYAHTRMFCLMRNLFLFANTWCYRCSMPIQILERRCAIRPRKHHKYRTRTCPHTTQGKGLRRVLTQCATPCKVEEKGISQKTSILSILQTLCIWLTWNLETCHSSTPNPEHGPCPETFKPLDKTSCGYLRSSRSRPVFHRSLIVPSMNRVSFSPAHDIKGNNNIITPQRGPGATQLRPFGPC